MGKNRDSDYSQDWGEASREPPQQSSDPFEAYTDRSGGLRADREQARREWIRDSIPYWIFLVIVVVLYGAFLMRMN